MTLTPKRFEVSVVFFDIDDTLLDYKTSQNLAALMFARRYSEYVEAPEAFPEFWNELTERHMARYLSGELTFQEQQRCRVRDGLGVDLSSEEADRAFADYYEVYQESWSLFPDVKDMLGGMSAYPLGIITNGDKEQQCYKLERLGILAYFDTVVTPACAGAAKPDPEIYNLAATRAGLNSSECWYVGDNYASDYVGAKKAGFRAIWLNRNEEPTRCDDQCLNLMDVALKITGSE